MKLKENLTTKNKKFREKIFLFIKKSFKSLKDELFPIDFECLICNEELNVSNEFLCDKCKNELFFVKNPCKKCGDNINGNYDYCIKCKNEIIYFDKATSPFVYDKVAKKLIYDLKYNNKKYISKFFSKYLVDNFLNFLLDKIDVITCVPLNNNKLKLRGYNQAEVLAKDFVYELKLHGVNDYVENYHVIKRVKDTPTQTHLTKDERKNNLLNAFRLNCKKSLIKNKSILIVDDVFTTGATMNEIAKLLKRNGASKVYCLTCCHTQLNTVEYN